MKKGDESDLMAREGTNHGKFRFRIRERMFAKVWELLIPLTRGFILLLLGDQRTPRPNASERTALSSERFSSVLSRLFSIYPGSPSMCLWRAKEMTALEDFPFDEPVLDLGCGDGGFAYLLLGNRKVFGIDLEPGALARAAERNNYRGLAIADVVSLPFGRDIFGSVLVNCVAEHVDEPGALLKEAWRVTKPGGLIAMTVPSDKFARFFGPRLILSKLGMSAKGEKTLAVYNERQRHLNMDGVETWRKRFESAGWVEFSARPIVEPECAVLFSALDFLWISPLPWKKRKKPGGGGAWINHWMHKLGRGRESELWIKMFERLAGNAPDPPEQGAGLLISARKPG